MPFSVNWVNAEATLLELQITEPYSLDDLLEIMETCNREIDAVGHPVLSLVDLSQTDGLPEGMLVRFNELSGLSNQNVIHTVVILGDRIAVMIGGLMGRLMGNMTVVTNHDAADEVLSRYMTQVHA